MTMYTPERETLFFSVISQPDKELSPIRPREAMAMQSGAYYRLAGLSTRPAIEEGFPLNGSRYAKVESARCNPLTIWRLPQTADSADSSCPWGLHDA
jgi:hypothetical protein